MAGKVGKVSRNLQNQKAKRLSGSPVHQRIVTSPPILPDFTEFYLRKYFHECFERRHNLHSTPPNRPLSGL
ncbi:MAG: hypothetical protein EBS01_01265 [Verrucomicrobia bacterium]|nr:hypothetical protein [Verrucomicrobiota bacterium]